jgi:threonine/homoserine efflux transporter RhtA
MFTAMACATVALVVLIERRRQGLSGNPVGAVCASREGSRFAYYVPFAILITLGVIVDRIPW